MRPRSNLPCFLALILGGLIWAGVIFLLFAGVKAVSADHYMCSNYKPSLPVSISVDPNLQGSGITSLDVVAAINKWNSVTGRVVFTVHRGSWITADALLTNNGSKWTWVNSICNSGFNLRGNNQAVIYIGNGDAWRNAIWLEHELGHALGLADHTNNPIPQHINPGPCGSLSSGYNGVMSYCTSQQNWLSIFSNDALMIWRMN
jgi:hypothetical protein